MTYTRSSKGIIFKEDILNPPLFTFSDGSENIDDDDDDEDEQVVIDGGANDSEPTEADVFNTRVVLSHIRAVLSRLRTFFSFRSLSLSCLSSSFACVCRSFSVSRLDNVGREGDRSLVHSDKDLEGAIVVVVLVLALGLVVVVVVVVILPDEGNHEEKLVRKRDNKELEERRDWDSLAAARPAFGGLWSLLVIKASCHMAKLIVKNENR